MNKEEIFLSLIRKIHTGKLQSVKTILNENPWIDLNGNKNSYFENPLTQAVRYAEYEIAKFLISKGANVNYSIDNIGYPLESAVFSAEDKRLKASEKIVKTLLDNNADVDAYEFGRLSVLANAAIDNNIYVINELLPYNPDINRMSLQNFLTPLELSIIWKKKEAEDILRANGGLSNIRGEYDFLAEPGGGISSHMNIIGRVVPMKFREDNDGVFYRLCVTNKDDTTLLYSTGNYQFTKPFQEFIMALPWAWNPYSKKPAAEFPYRLLNALKEQLKSGKQFTDGDFIDRNDEHFIELDGWPESIAGFYVVDYEYPKLPHEVKKSDTTENKDDSVTLFTLIPVKRTKKGYTVQPLEKLKSKKWRAITFSDVECLDPIHSL